MTNYGHYKIARDRAWEVLAEVGVSELPVDLMQIINFYKIKVVAYSRSHYVGTSPIEIQYGDGFSKIEGNNKVIYFNDTKGTKERRRFTIAHELGHCLLGHDLRKIKYRNSESDDGDSIEEMQANVFARDILMPAVVLHFKKCLDYKKIMVLCEVSEVSAKIRAERMQILEKRNKFCTSPLEKQVYYNFFN